MERVYDWQQRVSSSGLAGPGGKWASPGPKKTAKIKMKGPRRARILELLAPTFTRPRSAARWEGPGLALTCASYKEPWAGSPCKKNNALLLPLRSAARADVAASMKARGVAGDTDPHSHPKNRPY